MARRRKRRVFFTGDPNGIQPGDDVGNRLKKLALRVPADDIGNRRSDDPDLEIPPDNLGNRVEAMPTHEMSGILWDKVDAKGKTSQRRRRLKTGGPPERVGRYFVGGVNPAVAGDVTRAQEAQEGAYKRRRDRPPGDAEGDDKVAEDSRESNGPRESPRRRKPRGYDQVDGSQAQEINRRRAARFFDFAEDDRFSYSLKSPAKDKRRDAETCVQRVLDEAGRDATAKAILLPDGERPKVLVTIDDRGPSPDVPEDRRASGASDPLFPMGSATLMSLNYLVNKIVNRYPDDRIRLVILPADEEKAYCDALQTHMAARPEGAEAAPATNKSSRGRRSGRSRHTGGESAAEDTPAENSEAASEAAGPSAEDSAIEETVEDKPPTKKALAKTTKKAPAKKVAAKKTPTKTATVKTARTTKKVALPAKKTSAKTATAKKAPVKKALAKKAVAKKAPAKKATAKKVAAKKAPAKKATVKKVAAKKAPAKKATVKKVAAKKAAKKTTKKAAKKSA